MAIHKKCINWLTNGSDDGDGDKMEEKKKIWYAMNQVH